MSSDWKKELEDVRKEKDRFFEESPDSPIPQEDRSEFSGLAYFPIDSDYRFELNFLILYTFSRLSRDQDTTSDNAGCICRASYNGSTEPLPAYIKLITPCNRIGAYGPTI